MAQHYFVEARESDPYRKGAKHPTLYNPSQRCAAPAAERAAILERIRRTMWRAVA